MEWPGVIFFFLFFLPFFFPLFFLLFFSLFRSFSLFFFQTTTTSLLQCHPFFSPSLFFSVPHVFPEELTSPYVRPNYDYYYNAHPITNQTYYTNRIKSIKTDIKRYEEANVDSKKLIAKYQECLALWKSLVKFFYLFLFFFSSLFSLLFFQKRKGEMKMKTNVELKS